MVFGMYTPEMRAARKNHIITVREQVNERSHAVVPWSSHVIIHKVCKGPNNTKRRKCPARTHPAVPLLRRNRKKKKCKRCNKREETPSFYLFFSHGPTSVLL